MSEFNKRVYEIDTRIKRIVQNTIKSIGLSVDFNGYYVEDNDYSYSMSPQPMYSNLNEYADDNPRTGNITHIRYFLN